MALTQAARKPPGSSINNDIPGSSKSPVGSPRYPAFLARAQQPQAQSGAKAPATGLVADSGGSTKLGPEVLENPLQHPEWPQFLAAAQSILQEDEKAFGSWTPERIWTTVIEGIRIGKDADPKEPGDPRWKQAEAKFQAVADALAGTMKIEQAGGAMALWSGGPAVSTYAESKKAKVKTKQGEEEKGLQTMGTTPFARLFTTLLLYTESWHAVRPLWATFSRKFVDQYERGEVWCYMRGWNPNSIFVQVEHPALLAKGDQITLKYHALCGPDADIRELDPEGNVLAKGAECELGSLKAMELALTRYQEKQKQINPQSSQRAPAARGPTPPQSAVA